MAALDFPSSPTNGQYYNGYIYNAANDTWDSAYAPRAATIPLAGTNYIINGAFDIWQRGTSFSLSVPAYTADRWNVDHGTVTRQLSGGIAGTTYCVQVANASGNPAVRQAVELQATGVAGDFAVGTTWTISFYAKVSTTVSSNMALYIAFSDSLGISNAVQLVSVNSLPVPGTSWTQYSYTFTISASPAGTNKCVLVVPYLNSGSYAGNFSVTGVQLEQGSAATPFRRNAPSIAGELAACQRYYFRAVAESSFGYFGMANAYAVNNAMAWVQHPVVMRTIASSVEWNGTGANYMLNNGAAGYNLTSFALNAGDSSSRMTAIAVSATGPTAGTFWRLMPNGAPAAYIGINAEL